MRAAILTLMILATALSGCTTDDAPTADSDGVTGGSADATESNQQVAATGPPMLPAPPDVWGDETELVLVDETQGPMDRGYPGCFRLVGFGMYQCVLVRLPEGTLLPHGTSQLRVDVGSGSSQGAGRLSSEVFQTAGRTSASDEALDGEPQSGTELSWTFDMVPEDWDPVDAATSSLQINVWNDGESGLLGVRSGSFHVTVTAIRDPEWEAVSPGPDPWFQHPLLVDEDAMQLHDSNFTATVGGFTLDRGAYVGFEVTLDAPIPAETTTLLLGASYDGLSCAPASDCFLVADVIHSDGSWYQPHAAPEFDGDWTVLRFDLPGLVEPGSENSFWVYAAQCDPVMQAYQIQYPDSNCLPMATESELNLRVHVEAWRTEPDMDAFKERLGV